MEATMFTGWIYAHLKPRAAGLKVAHPLMLCAIAAAKKKETIHGVIRQQKGQKSNREGDLPQFGSKKGTKTCRNHC